MNHHVWLLLVSCCLSIHVVHMTQDFFNEIQGEPQVQCGHGTISVKIGTAEQEPSYMFAKGYHGKDGCSFNHVHEATFNFDVCNMNRKREIHPKGMAYSLTVIVQLHPLFITKVDRAYHVRCFYMEANKAVSADITVGELATATLESGHMLPQCMYGLHMDGPNGPSVRYAQVGDRIWHVWDCPSDVYGMLVHSCYVLDGQGNEVQIIDEHGCSVDQYVIQTPQYSADLTRAQQETSVFKFADKISVAFNCQIRLCFKNDDTCKGFTPPKCQQQGIAIFKETEFKEVLDASTTDATLTTDVTSTTDAASTSTTSHLDDDFSSDQLITTTTTTFGSSSTFTPTTTTTSTTTASTSTTSAPSTIGSAVRATSKTILFQRSSSLSSSSSSSSTSTTTSTIAPFPTPENLDTFAQNHLRRSGNRQQQLVMATEKQPSALERPDNMIVVDESSGEEPSPTTTIPASQPHRDRLMLDSARGRRNTRLRDHVPAGFIDIDIDSDELTVLEQDQVLPNRVVSADNRRPADDRRSSNNWSNVDIVPNSRQEQRVSNNQICVSLTGFWALLISTLLIVAGAGAMTIVMIRQRHAVKTIDQIRAIDYF